MKQKNLNQKLIEFKPTIPSVKGYAQGRLHVHSIQNGLSGTDKVRLRVLPHLYQSAKYDLRASVIVPARNEAKRLPALIQALAAQQDSTGRIFKCGIFDVLILLNNTTDRSSSVVAQLIAQYPMLKIQVASVSLGKHESHVGRARQIVMDAAWDRLDSIGQFNGLILSTDADTAPDSHWLMETQAEISTGVDVIGGRALLLPAERHALTPRVRRLYLLDLAYRRALEELKNLYIPDPYDPFPRHHQHFGASLAVSVAAYGAIGGLSAIEVSEDVALVQALTDAGYRMRHSDRVRVYTSARSQGRAQGGLADAFKWWEGMTATNQEPLVEPAIQADFRLSSLGRTHRKLQKSVPPLTVTPEAVVNAAAPLSLTITSLRRRIAQLRPLSLDDRLSLPSMQ